MVLFAAVSLSHSFFVKKDTQDKDDRRDVSDRRDASDRRTTSDRRATSDRRSTSDRKDVTDRDAEDALKTVMKRVSSMTLWDSNSNSNLLDSNIISTK